jgi:hypothetical protein
MALSIKADNQKDYENQFGINLRRPSLPVEIETAPALLQAASGLAQDSMQSSATLQSIVQALIKNDQPELNQLAGDINMNMIDMQDFGMQETPVIMVAEYNSENHPAPEVEKFWQQLIKENQQKDKLKQQPEHIMGVCETVPNIPNNSGSTISAYADVSDYFSYFQNWEINHTEGNASLDFVSQKIIQPPEHGKLTEIIKQGKYPNYLYQPDQNYYGNDLAIVEGEVNGLKVKIYYLLISIDSPATGTEGCQKFNLLHWKISSLDSNNPVNSGVSANVSSTSKSLYNLSLPTAFIGNNINAYPNITYTFTNLTGAAEL